MKTLVNFIVGAIIIVVVDRLFSSVYVAGYSTAVLVAVVLTLLNKTIKPILSFLAIPITFLTLGLFQLVINGFIIYLATLILRPDFQVNSFSMMIVVSICLSIMNNVVGIEND